MEEIKEKVAAVLDRFSIDAEKFWNIYNEISPEEAVSISELREKLNASKPAVIQSMNVLSNEGCIKKSWKVGCAYCGETVLSVDDIDELKDETRMCKACGSPNTIYIGNAEVFYKKIKL